MKSLKCTGVKPVTPGLYKCKDTVFNRSAFDLIVELEDCILVAYP